MSQFRVHSLWGAVVLLLWGSISVAAAQPTGEATPSVRFRRLDGLSHNTVSSILQDRRGLLWIGTADGLNRYDGYEFVVYRHRPSDSTSLIDNTVQALAEDPSGDLWIGTAGGLDRLDRATGHFVRPGVRPDSLNRSLNVEALAFDSAGALWMRTAERGMYRYDQEQQALIHYPRVLGTRSDPAERRTVAMSVGSGGQLWVSTRTTTPEGTLRLILHRYDAEHDRFCPVALPGRHQADEHLPQLHAGPSGTLWVGLHNQRVRIDTIADPLKAIPELPEGMEVRQLLEARDGTLWLGMKRGVYRYDPTAETLHHHQIEEAGTTWLSNNVRDLYEDRSGTVWVGTLSGLYRYDPHRKPFASLDLSSRGPNSRGRNAVMAVHAEGSGRLWAGTLGGGLYGLDHWGVDQKTGEQIHYRHRPGDPTSLPDDVVWALHENREGGLWVGTDDGLARFAPRTGTFRRHALPSPSSQSTPAVRIIRGGRGGALWIGDSGGLSLVDPRRGNAERRLTLGGVWALHVGSRAVWLGTEDEGLLRYAPETDSLRSYPFGTAGPAGLTGRTVWAIHEGPDSRLWLGTDLGLSRFDPNTETFYHVYDSDEWPGSIVYSIREDERGRLWLGTNRGLVRFDPGTGAVRSYDRGDGLGNVEFNRGAAFRSERGNLFFGGLSGITAFDPSAIRDNPYVPPVVITQMTKENRDGPVSINPYGREQVVLDYRDRVFTVEFAALNFTNPQKNRYAYQLDGFEDDWVEAGTRRVVRYTNVPPGEYVFRVKGSNNDGVWNEKGTSMRVTIAPPFWQRWWFQLLIGILLVGGLVLAYRVRVRHLLRIERLRLRIASDLHDDVASQLASVAITSDVLRATADLDEDERTELRQMGTLVRQTTETLRDIVWFVDPEHDRPEALLGKMNTAASTLLNGLDYDFDTPAPDQLSGLDALDVRARRNLFLIYKEALHNVVRHAYAETVQIALRPTAGGIELTVTDDGVGFDPDDTTQWGQGMKTMRRRAEQMDAALALTSRPREGTTLRLTVPKS